MGEYIEPFDFRKIFVEYFFGTEELASVGIIFLISFICAKYQMPNRIFLLTLTISVLIFSDIIGQVMLIPLLVVIGFISFKMIGRLIT